MGRRTGRRRTMNRIRRIRKGKKGMKEGGGG